MWLSPSWSFRSKAIHIKAYQKTSINNHIISNLAQKRLKRERTLRRPFHSASHSISAIKCNKNMQTWSCNKFHTKQLQSCHCGLQGGVLIQDWLLFWLDLLQPGVFIFDLGLQRLYGGSRSSPPNTPSASCLHIPLHKAMAINAVGVAIELDMELIFPRWVASAQLIKYVCQELHLFMSSSLIQVKSLSQKKNEIIPPSFPLSPCHPCAQRFSSASFISSDINCHSSSGSFVTRNSHRSSKLEFPSSLHSWLAWLVWAWLVWAWLVWLVSWISSVSCHWLVESLTHRKWSLSHMATSPTLASMPHLKHLGGMGLQTGAEVLCFNMIQYLGESYYFTNLP